jgi:cytoskeleton protein RodZ
MQHHDPSEVPESLGVYLRKSREDKSVSIEQVAYATRISLKMLRALEEDDHTALPAPTFVRGYLQAYAKYVRIDTQDLLLRYQHHLATAPDAKRGAIRSHYLYVRERYQEKRRLVSAILLFTVLLSMVGALFFYKAQRDKHKRLAQTAVMIQKSEEQKPQNTPTAQSPLARDVSIPTEPAKSPLKAPEKPAEKEPISAATTLPAPERPSKAPSPNPALPTNDIKKEMNEPAAVEPATPLPSTTGVDTGDKKNYQLMLKANQDVWLRFQTDDNEVRDLTLRSGKQMLLRADKVIKIFSGNLGAFTATLNGKELAPLATAKGMKSAVLPESEAPNYKLPLFPQFQVKHSTAPVDTMQDQPASNAPPQEDGVDNAPSPAPQP